MGVLCRVRPTGVSTALRDDDNTARAITVESGDSFVCDPSDTILRAALRAGFAFPYECNVGQCGSCRFELLKGEVEDLWPSAPALNERDRRKSRKLACQSRPISDCVIKVRADPDCAPLHRPVRRSVALISIRNVTHDIREFCFRGVEPAAFCPGQYALMQLPGVVGPRAYSMCNNANDDGEWHFLIKHVSGGVGTGVLFDDLRVGSSIIIDAPFGMAYLRDDVARDIVCIAGGSGLSPLISIARAASAPSALADRRISFFFGGRGPADICGEEYLRLLPGFGDRVTYQAAISMAELDVRQTWVGFVGFIHDFVEQALGVDVVKREFYLAGPPPMLQATLQMLVSRCKVPVTQVHFDRFF